ncbi:hypothetical protein AAU61_15520 [Desulfocarbo indianensis]|nr:hypothetical protein AAU61_15520 [Desulfocarbo indianensis]
MRLNRALVALGLALVLGMGVSLAVEAEVNKPEVCLDKELCAEKLRHGSEAFNRGRYSEAKAFFRQAVQADPTSIKAWSYYDLTIMYDAAEQVKRAGQVKTSGAPKPGCPEGVGAAPPIPGGGAASAPAPAPAAPAAIPAIPKDEGC